jgi:hypothetical protein
VWKLKSALDRRWPLTATDIVVLRGGVSVPAAAYLLAIDLESRGVHLAGDGDDLVVGPRDRLTDADRDALRQLKPYVLLLVGYRAPEVM